MIRRENEVEAVAEHEVQKGVGGVAFYTSITKGKAYGSGRTFARVVFEPGTFIGIHEHQEGFEGYYALKGQALVTDSDVELMLDPGDYHMCKDGGSHDIACYGDETMEVTALIINVPV